MKMSRHYGHIFWSTFFLTTILLIDLSEAQDLQIGDVTVTASRQQQKVEDVTPSTEIVTERDIEAISADTVEDALKYSTSVYFYQHMMRSTPSIRGFDGKHTLILIDGKRYASPQGKYDDPTRFLSENIERIEIVRGPMSALYGSEAMGGVINIITKKAKETHFDVGTKYGHYSHGKDKIDTFFDIQIADPSRKDFLGKLFFSLSGQKIWQDDLILGNGTTLLPDDDTSSLTGDLDIIFNDHFRLEFDGGYHETDKEHVLLTRGTLANSTNEYNSWDFSGALYYKSTIINAMFRGYTSHYEKDYIKRYREGKFKGQISAHGRDFEEGERKTHVLEAKFDRYFITPIGDHFFTIGGEYRKEEHESVRITSGDPCGTVSREGVTLDLGCYDPNIGSFYLQDEIVLGKRFSLVPAIRFDKYENFDSEWSPRIGLMFKLNDMFRIKANYGHAFRAPGPGELFKDYYGMGGRYHIVGNQNLEPETSNSFDIAFETSSKKWFGRFGFFYNDVDGLIHTTFKGKQDGTIVYQYENIDSATIKGLELEGALQIMTGLRLGINFTYLDADDDSTGERLTGKPRYMTNLKLDYTYLPWDLTFNFRLRYMGDYGYKVGGRGNPEEFKNDSECITSIKVTKGITKNIDIYAGADNIFDKYKAYYGSTADDGILQEPGTFFYGGIKLHY